MWFPSYFKCNEFCNLLLNKNKVELNTDNLIELLLHNKIVMAY
jgi:hypothetical protein